MVLKIKLELQQECSQPAKLYKRSNDVIYSFRFVFAFAVTVVSGYFALAAARHGRLDIFAQEMASLVDLSEQQDTFAEFYELDKSFPPKRRRQLWSDTGYLGMVYKGVFGMNFQPDGIEFSPSKDDGKSTGLAMDDTISLLNVKYRGCILDIHVTGVGNNVMSFKVNGKVRESPKIDSNSTGRYLIEIEVAPS